MTCAFTLRLKCHPSSALSDGTKRGSYLVDKRRALLGLALRPIGIEPILEV